MGREATKLGPHQPWFTAHYISRAGWRSRVWISRKLMAFQGHLTCLSSGRRRRGGRTLSFPRFPIEKHGKNQMARSFSTPLNGVLERRRPLFRSEWRHYGSPNWSLMCLVRLFPAIAVMYGGTGGRFGKFTFIGKAAKEFFGGNGKV